MNYSSETLNKPWTKLFLACVILIVSLAAYFYPIFQKGYPPTASFLSLIQARNFALSRTYNYESLDGVLLSSERAKFEGKETALLNPLTAIIFGRVFKYIGPDNISLSSLFYIAIVSAALFNVMIFLLIARLFGTAVGFVSATIIILFPLRVVSAISLMSHEFAMLFFGAALFLYLGSKKGPFEAGLFRVSVSSIFFALTALSQNAFLFSFPPFALYDFYKRRSVKRSALFVLPFILIFVSTLTPYSWLGVPNGYLAPFDSQPFGQIGHVFNDPYSAYYDRDNILKEIQEKGTLGRLETHYFKQWGYGVSFRDRLFAYKDSAVYYLAETVSLTTLGGPLLILFMLLGGYWLYRNKKDILGLFGIWLVMWFLGLVYFETGNRGHFVETILIWGSLAGLGIYNLSQSLELSHIKKSVIAFVLILLTIGHLAYANRWKLFDVYASANMGTILDFKGKLDQIESEGLIAADINQNFAASLNYFANRDVIYFDYETVAKLIKEGRLKQAFEIYGVKTAVGFPESQTDDIKAMTGAEVIPNDEF